MNEAKLAELGLPALARRAISACVREGRSIEAGRAGAPRGGVFVTLRSPDGNLRGCIGSISPLESDVLAETVRSAVLAATRDPRFEPVRADELAGLHVEVSVLAPEEPIASPSELDPSIYGVIVRDRLGRRGLLLPGIEGVDDAATQIAIARQKAGISASEPVSLARFRVVKLVEA